MIIYENTDDTGNVQASTLRNDEGHVYYLVCGNKHQELNFQNGPVSEVGINGCHNEQVIAALVHRLGVLDKAFPCPENVIARGHLQQALYWLEKRTADRKARGVEGTNQA